MDSTKNGGDMAINVPESKSTKGNKAVAAVAPAAIVATTKAARYSQGGWKRGVAIFDFIVRLGAIGAALAAAAIMGTTDHSILSVPG